MINAYGTTFETEKFYLLNTTEIFYFILKILLIKFFTCFLFEKIVKYI